MHAHEWLQGMLKYNCIICCTMNPLPVVYFRRLVYEHGNGLCHIVEYKQILAKATLM